MVSIFLGVWNGGGVCCCPARCGGAARALLIPAAVLASTAVMSCTVTCRVCGVWWWVCVCGVRVVGYPLSAPPLVVVEGGAVVDGGVPLWMVGGMVSEGRQCCRLPRLVCGVPRLCVGVPSFVRSVAMLKGGGVCAVLSPVSCCPRSLHSVPCLRIRLAPCIV